MQSKLSKEESGLNEQTHISIVDTVIFACQNPKITKVLTILCWVAETSRLMWHNPFEHQSTQSAFSGQIDWNAPSQSWVD